MDTTADPPPTTNDASTSASRYCSGQLARKAGRYCPDAPSFRVSYRDDGSDAMDSCSKHLAQIVRVVRVCASPTLRRAVRVLELDVPA